jgi:hypothetical protein
VGGARGGGDVRGLALQLGEVGVGAKQKHAAVPVIAALCQVTLGGAAVGLLDEALQRAHPGRDLAAGLDVAIAGFRQRRHDAEGGEFAVSGGGHRCGDGAREGAHIQDHVIRGQHQQQGIAAPMPGDLQRRQRDGRGGVARRRLEQDAGCAAGAARLFRHQEAVLLARHHQRRAGLRDFAQAQEGLLQQRTLAGQVEKLLGMQLARQRPQARAGAAGQQDGDDHAANASAPAFSARPGVPWR